MNLKTQMMEATRLKKAQIYKTLTPITTSGSQMNTQATMKNLKMTKARMWDS